MQGYLGRFISCPLWAGKLKFDHHLLEFISSSNILYAIKGCIQYVMSVIYVSQIRESRWYIAPVCTCNVVKLWLIIFELLRVSVNVANARTRVRVISLIWSAWCSWQLEQCKALLKHSTFKRICCSITLSFNDYFKQFASAMALHLIFLLH